MSISPKYVASLEAMGFWCRCRQLDGAVKVVNQRHSCPCLLFLFACWKHLLLSFVWGFFLCVSATFKYNFNSQILYLSLVFSLLNIPYKSVCSWVSGILQQPAQPPWLRVKGTAVSRTPYRSYLRRQSLSEAPYEESQPESGGPSATSTHRHISH